MDTHDRRAQKAKLTLAGLAVLAAAGLAAGGVAAYSLLGKDDSEKGAAAPQPPRNQARPRPGPVAAAG